MRLILLRHPPVASAGVCYGLSEVSLTKQWRALAAPVIEQLPHYDLCVSSPARRCRALLQLLPGGGSAGAGLERIDPRLRELNFGSWEGLPWEDIDSAALRAWKANLAHAAPPGGESLASLHTRVLAWLAEVRARNQARSVLCITHLGVVRCILAHAMGWELEKSMSLKVDFLSTHIVDCTADGCFELADGLALG